MQLIHPSGIINLSEAARTKQWGSRQTLSAYVKRGLPGRRIGPAFWTTVEHLNNFQAPKRGPKHKSKENL